MTAEEIKPSEVDTEAATLAKETAKASDALLDALRKRHPKYKPNDVVIKQRKTLGLKWQKDRA